MDGPQVKTMDLKRHDGGPLPYLVAEPDGYDSDSRYPMIILLHGFGAHMGDLAGLSHEIDTGSYLYAFPNAPLPMDTGTGGTGYAWFPFGEAGEAEAAAESDGLLREFIKEVLDRYNIEPGRAILGGFSQGGMMTLRVGLSAPDPFSGLVVLSSRLPDPDEMSGPAPADPPIPIFMAHGTLDPIVPVDDARRSRRTLEARGYRPDYREYEMAHQISREVLDDLVPWIHRVLPPNDDDAVDPPMGMD